MRLTDRMRKAKDRIVYARSQWIYWCGKRDQHHLDHLDAKHRAEEWRVKLAKAEEDCLRCAGKDSRLYKPPCISRSVCFSKDAITTREAEEMLALLEAVVGDQSAPARVRKPHRRRSAVKTLPPPADKRVEEEDATQQSDTEDTGVDGVGEPDAVAPA